MSAFCWIELVQFTVQPQPETDAEIAGKGQVGSPNWSGFYWRISIGGEW